MGEALFVYVCNDRGQGDEIVCAVLPQLGPSPIPLVFANERVARKARHIAEGHAKGLGLPVRLVKFTHREVLETITPGGQA